MGMPIKRTKKMAESVLATDCGFKLNRGKSKSNHVQAANDNKPTSTVEPEVLEGGKLKLQLFALLFISPDPIHQVPDTQVPSW